MTRISILAGRRARMNPLGQIRRRRGLLVVGALLALATVFGVGTASADPADPPVNTAPPEISGTAQSRLTLTADPGSWSGNTSGGFSYQWQRCNAAGANCNPISGATNSTYTAQDSEIGATVVVEVTALDGPTVAASAATAVVGYPAPYGGSCSFVPNYGEAALTTFSVGCSELERLHPADTAHLPGRVVRGMRRRRIRRRLLLRVCLRPDHRPVGRGQGQRLLLQ